MSNDFLKSLMQPPPEDQVFSATKVMMLPVQLSAEIIAEDEGQAIDIATHDLVTWRIEQANGRRVEAREIQRAHARALARREIEQWRSVAWCFAVMWATEALLPKILRVLQ